MNTERQRPIKQFRVLQAYGPYVKGQLIQPTGMYRDVLVRRGVIEEVKDAAPARQAPGLVDRMVQTARESAGSMLASRSNRRKH